MTYSALRIHLRLETWDEYVWKVTSHQSPVTCHIPLLNTFSPVTARASERAPSQAHAPIIARHRQSQSHTDYVGTTRETWRLRSGARRVKVAWEHKLGTTRVCNWMMTRAGTRGWNGNTTRCFIPVHTAPLYNKKTVRACENEQVHEDQEHEDMAMWTDNK
jgi:hypothetical protein